MQPVTTYDIVRLLLKFVSCEYKYRAQLEQYVENITLAQALGAPWLHRLPGACCPAPLASTVAALIWRACAVFPLLKYEPSVLAVTAVVCGVHLVVKQTHKDVSMDEGLNNGLAELCEVEVERTLRCRREVVKFINLDNLVRTEEAAQAQPRASTQCTPHAGRRASGQSTPRQKRPKCK